MITWHLYCKTLIGRGLTDALNPGFYCVFYSYSLGRQIFHLILRVLLPLEGIFILLLFQTNALVQKLQCFCPQIQASNHFTVDNFVIFPEFDTDLEYRYF